MDENETGEEKTPKPEGREPEPEPKPEPQGTDWKAEARKWEERAKDNKAKADMWDERGGDVEGLRSQLEDARRERDAAKADAERQRTAARVSGETGVPAELITGEGEEEMRRSAEAIAAFAASARAAYPPDKGAGASARESRESIERIKNPVERVMARAQHIDLYK